MAKKRCLFCQRWFNPYAPQAKRQQICGRPDCKRKLKRTLDRRWRRSKPGWREKINASLRAWAKAYPRYWHCYREKHRGYVARDNERRARALRQERWGCSAKQER